MYTSADLGGIMAMMPAFATADATSIEARSTIHIENLKAGVDKIIDDGIGVIATAGSFGEFHTLLWEEFETLTRATVEAVRGRVPLFIGCTGLNSREVVRKMEVARAAGARGVMVGVPFYFPSTVDNAVRFFRDIGKLFPEMAIMVYHNPTLHNVTLPVEAFTELAKIPNIVAMKDSHRDPVSVMRLMDIMKGRMSVFVYQAQYFVYRDLGAAGFWSIDAWMGPAPLLALRDAVDKGESARAKQITLDIAGAIIGPQSLSWRETASKISQVYAGYCNPGPLRPPFMEIPDSVDSNARLTAEYWNGLCKKYARQGAKR